MYSDVKYPDFKGHGNPLFRVPVIVAFILGALVLYSDVKAWPFVIMLPIPVRGAQCCVCESDGETGRL